MSWFSSISNAWGDAWSEIADNAGSILTGALEGAASGAATGAYVGSVVPGWGTLAGAIIGAVGGAVVGGTAGYVSGSEQNKQDDIDQTTIDLDTENFNIGLDEVINGKNANIASLQDSNTGYTTQINDYTSELGTLNTFFDRFKDNSTMELNEQKASGSSTYDAYRYSFADALTSSAGMGHVGGSSEVANTYERNQLADYAGSDLKISDSDAINAADTSKISSGTTQSNLLTFDANDGLYGQEIKSLYNDQVATYKTSLNEKTDIASSIESLQDSITKNKVTIEDYQSQVAEDKKKYITA